MTEFEIAQSVRLARYPKRQIAITAQLSLLSRERVREICIRNGISFERPKRRKPAPPPPANPIAVARLSRGWSQKQLAELLGVRQATLSNWEHGVFSPGQRSRKNLCRLFPELTEMLAKKGKAARNQITDGNPKSTTPVL